MIFLDKFLDLPKNDLQLKKCHSKAQILPSYYIKNININIYYPEKEVNITCIDRSSSVHRTLFPYYISGKCN